MPRLDWDEPGKKFYETGVDRVVVYPKTSADTYGNGYAWSGVTAFSENMEGAEAEAIYADNIKYLNLYSAPECTASIEAYYYPDKFMECDGTAEPYEGLYIPMQKRTEFGLCVRTKIGSDEDGDSHGYKIHILYNCYAAPSERSYETVNDSPEAMTFSWDITTTPIEVPDMTIGSVVKKFKPTALVTIDTTKISDTKLAALENIIYGEPASTSDGTEDPGDPATMPTIQQLIDIISTT